MIASQFMQECGVPKKKSIFGYSQKQIRPLYCVNDNQYHLTGDKQNDEEHTTQFICNNSFNPG
ncbi:hypothetical protein GCM10010918_30790 [Paenibacillus radicis (ex Gao et al. 2016)]|uniref:Uncharacterized protein n=1 Tax=Paenibacillus radicis (ex Gao et al. 2016) TaxID=1737354 RepID=A0A917M2B9_9BACL|nr:hypothetical protein GCM10010918_30790 [Paenibacillus radicis (ex Gao et al. 2016)]